MKLGESSKKAIALEILFFFLAVSSIAFLWQDNLVLFVVLLVESAAILKLWHKKNDMFYFIVGAILGPVGEMICIHLGAWTYSNITALGIPIWLPLAWGVISLLLTRIPRSIINAIVK